ncbi:hypothetical protein [Sunxiuqinia elliptica]|uniref:hypothetical protein n=1 Tax=Sunxiuqinia elliptica TaxID=655355 RepID=UPI000B81468D|nr:hypothetical protein [Sunxiuqinia elliptica]
MAINTILGESIITDQNSFPGTNNLSKKAVLNGQPFSFTGSCDFFYYPATAFPFPAAIAAALLHFFKSLRSLLPSCNSINESCGAGKQKTNAERLGLTQGTSIHCRTAPIVRMSSLETCQSENTKAEFSNQLAWLENSACSIVNFFPFS